MARSDTKRRIPDGYRDMIFRARAAVREIIPGGRNPEPSYMAKDEALRILDRLAGER